jgi:hypothetical protein
MKTDGLGKHRNAGMSMWTVTPSRIGGEYATNDNPGDNFHVFLSGTGNYLQATKTDGKMTEIRHCRKFHWQAPQ